MEEESKKILDSLPKEFRIHNPYNVPVHDQGDKNSCTAHVFAVMLEYQLSPFFKELTLIDVDDLWEKQKRFGTASEERGDLPDGPYRMAVKCGVRFITKSRKTGTIFASGNGGVQNGIMTHQIGPIKLDGIFKNLFSRILGFHRHNRFLFWLRSLTMHRMNTNTDLQQQINSPNDRIEQYLSEFTQRINVLLTVAALMSGLAASQPSYLKTFLLTSFPLFIFAIFFYLLSSRRLNLLSAEWRNELAVMLKKSYLSARKWYLLTDLSLTSFFVAFVVNLYFFAFDVEILTRDIIFIYATAFLVGFLRYFYIKAITNQTSEVTAIRGTSGDEIYFAGARPLAASTSSLGDLEK